LENLRFYEKPGLSPTFSFNAILPVFFKFVSKLKARNAQKSGVAGVPNRKFRSGSGCPSQEATLMKKGLRLERKAVVGVLV